MNNNDDSNNFFQIGNIYRSLIIYQGVSLVAQTVKNLPAMWETQV